MVKAEIVIDGVPEGFEVVRFGVPKKGDLYLDDGDVVPWAPYCSYPPLLILKKQPALYTVPMELPEGYRPIAFRCPCVGEKFISAHGGIAECRSGNVDPRLVVEAS